MRLNISSVKVWASKLELGLCRGSLASQRTVESKYHTGSNWLFMNGVTEFLPKSSMSLVRFLEWGLKSKIEIHQKFRQRAAIPKMLRNSSGNRFRKPFIDWMYLAYLHVVMPIDLIVGRKLSARLVGDFFIFCLWSTYHAFEFFSLHNSRNVKASGNWKPFLARFEKKFWSAFFIVPSVCKYYYAKWP